MSDLVASKTPPATRPLAYLTSAVGAHAALTGLRSHGEPGPGPSATVSVGEPATPASAAPKPRRKRVPK